jgi:hypothetical protein
MKRKKAKKGKIINKHYLRYPFCFFICCNKFNKDYEQFLIFVTSAPFNAFCNPEGKGLSAVVYKIIVHNV